MLRTQRRINEARLLDEVLKRVRQKHHRMGSDVPFWAQDALDDAHALGACLWASIWRGVLFSVVLTAVWDIYAIGRSLPFVGFSSTVPFGIMFGMLAGGLAAPFRRHRHYDDD